MAKERVQRAIQAVKEARFVPTCPPWARSEIAQLIYDVEAREPNLVQRYAGKLSASGLELIELGCNLCMADAWGALNKHYRRIPFRIEELFSCIHAALQDTDGLTRNERRKLASQILSNSSLLAIALEERDLYPDWRASVSRDLGERLRLPLRMFVGEAEAIDSQTDEQLGMFAATILSELLEGLEDGVRRWGANSPPLAKPNHPNAARLHFLRETAAWTKARFGKPLWDVVLALASIHFNCDDLDADSVRLIVSRASHP